MVKIRLVRSGVKKRPFYKIVIADSRFPRNGRFIEKIGFFKPVLDSKNLHNIYLNTSRVTYWMKCGAIMSKRVKKLVKLHSDANNVEQNN